jgi:hypothetical protein
MPLFLAAGKGVLELLSFKTLSFLAEYETGYKDYVDLVKFNNSGDMIMARD